VSGQNVFMVRIVGHSQNRMLITAFHAIWGSLAGMPFGRQQVKNFRKENHRC